VPRIRGGQVGGWRGRAGRLMMPVDTANQVVCTMGHTDGHSNPDHTTSYADVQWDRIGPQAIL